MNHKTDMQAKLQRIASELRAYNPAADEYKGEHIHKVWAREIEAALASRPDAQAGERYDLLQAAVNCPHEIESNRVVLHYSDKQPGHNALAQLRERLTRAAAPQAEAAQGVPDGRKLVPIEPTEKQRQAGAQYAECGIGANAVFCYRAMLDAAPSPDREQVGATEPERCECNLHDTDSACPYGYEASPSGEQVGDATGLSYQSRALLLNVLWHHQGGSSPVGQPIRALLGIGQHDHLTGEQLSEAKRIEGMLAWHEAPDTSPSRECGEISEVSPIVAPYPNCQFRICDLPGQCRSEGKCHHPVRVRECGEWQGVAGPERFIADNLTASERADGRLMNLIVLAWEASARTAASEPTPSGQCVHAKGIIGDEGGTPCCPLTMTPDASAPTLGEAVSDESILADAEEAFGRSREYSNCFAEPSERSLLHFVKKYMNAAPAVAQPLTAEQIIDLWIASCRSDTCSNDHDRAVHFARALLSKGE